MILLCIDTTKQNAELALYNNKKSSYLTLSEQKHHSESLLFELEQFLFDNKLTIQDVTTFGCVTGPGSFTGIRIGMSAVKAFCMALKTNIVSDNYFSVVASYVKNGFVAVKNTSSSVYLAEIENCQVKSVSVEENSKVLSIVNNKPLFVSEFEQIDMLSSYNNISVIKNYNKVMLDYFVNKAESGNYTNSSEFSPFYAQLSQAERSVKE